jgi:hypothetical protein
MDASTADEVTTRPGALNRPEKRDEPMTLHLRKKNPPAPTPAPPPPPPAAPALYEETPATPAEVVQELRDELNGMRGHTGNNHVEELVDVVDRTLEALQALFADVPATSSDVIAAGARANREFLADAERGNRDNSDDE